MISNMKAYVTGAAQMLLRALNTLDYRIVDHGIMTAHIVAAMMKQEKTITQRELTQSIHVALFHDIGAFKTEQLDSLAGLAQMMEFELKSPLAHSVYGYLFLKNFSFLEDYSDAVLFHHVTYQALIESECKNKDLAAKLFLADHVSFMISQRRVSSASEVLDLLDNPVFQPKLKEWLAVAERDEGTLSQLFEAAYTDELKMLLDTAILTKEESASIAGMVPYIIDFRSAQTAVHTSTVVEASLVIAGLFELPEEERVKLYYGSLLHDIGKVATSLLILEKDGSLDDKEFSIMKDHVVLSESILTGQVSDEIVKIAVRHHEKLDGSGYHHGLKAEDLSFNERIVAVADIISALMGQRSYKPAFPCEKVKQIISSMADSGKICPVIVKKVLDNFALMEKRVSICNACTMERYRRTEDEFTQLMEEYRQLFRRGE